MTPNLPDEFIRHAYSQLDVFSCEPLFDVRPFPLCFPCWRQLQPAPALRSRKAAPAAALAMTRSRCRVRVMHRDRSKPRHGAADRAPKPTSRAAPRAKVAVVVAANFDGAWVVNSVGCGGTTTGAVIVTSGRIIGEGVSGTISPDGVVRTGRQLQWHRRHQFRPRFQPQRRRNLPAIERLWRDLDGVKAVIVRARFPETPFHAHS